MKLLTIGAFARASRLSPKALRLYDELGLLRPVRVDEYSGYRYHSPDQLEQARLVAWLRRIGMPLAAIAEISGRRPAEVAAAVTAFLRVTEADFSEPPSSRPPRSGKRSPPPTRRQRTWCGS